MTFSAGHPGLKRTQSLNVDRHGNHPDYKVIACLPEDMTDLTAEKRGRGHGRKCRHHHGEKKKRANKATMTSNHAMTSLNGHDEGHANEGSTTSTSSTHVLQLKKSKTISVIYCRNKRISSRSVNTNPSNPCKNVYHV